MCYFPNIIHSHSIKKVPSPWTTVPKTIITDRSYTTLFRSVTSFDIDLMVELKESNVTTSIRGKLFRWKESLIFARKLDSCISKIIWNICYGVNKWHAKYKKLAEFGKKWILKKRRFLNNAVLMIRFLHHWQLSEEVYTLDIQKRLIMYTNTLMIFCQW